MAFPIDFQIKKTNEKPELYCIYNNKYMNIFEQKILDDIKANMDCPIDSINGQAPFEILLNSVEILKLAKILTVLLQISLIPIMEKI